MLGSIPSGWAVATLGELCSQISDGTHQTPRYVSNGVPFYSVESVTNDDFENVKYITKEEARAIGRRAQPKRGDIMMTRIGTLAKTKYVDWDTAASVYVSLAILRPGPGIDGRFLYAYTKSEQFVKDVEDRSLAWAIPKKINMGDILDVPVMYPGDRAEQLRIADVVLTIDAQLLALDRAVAKKRDIKQGMMQELLTGRIRLPGFSGQWRSMTFGDVVRIQRGSTLTRAQAGKGRIPVIAGGKIPAGYTDRPNRTGRTITISASGASAGYVAIYSGEIFASDCSTISRSKTFDLDFIYYSLLLRQDAIYRAQTGGAQPHIHARDIYPIGVQMPMSIDEQNAISRVLRDVDDEIATLERRLEAARAIKRGMMQELLTGRTRLAEEVAA